METGSKREETEFRSLQVIREVKTGPTLRSCRRSTSSRSGLILESEDGGLERWLGVSTENVPGRVTKVRGDRR